MNQTHENVGNTNEDAPVMKASFVLSELGSERIQSLNALPPANNDIFNP